MKNLFFSFLNESETNIILGRDLIEKYIFYLHQKSKIQVFVDTKISDKLKGWGFIIKLHANEKVKSFDKYMDISPKIDSFGKVLIIASGSIIDLVGSCALSRNAKKMILVPTNISSSIFLPIKGFFYLNFFWKKDALSFKGFPQEIYIDISIFNSLKKNQVKRELSIPFILGYSTNGKLADLSILYSKGENIDLEDFIYAAIKIWINLVSYGIKFFPGELFARGFYNINTKFLVDFPTALSLGFLLETYLLWTYGYAKFEYFEKLKEKLSNFGVFKPNIFEKYELPEIPDKYETVISGSFKRIILDKMQLNKLLIEFYDEIKR